MSWVFEPPERPALRVVGSDARVAVRRVFCIGRNYGAHAREMGGDPEREPPFFFAKPADAVCDAEPSSALRLTYPPRTQQLHHEVELAVVLGAGGRDLAPSEALACVFGYGVALDLTRRDRQREAKAKGRPWAEAKGFDDSAPISWIRPATETGHPDAGRIWLEVDGVVRQDGNLAEMIWGVPELIARLSRTVALAAGDVILTGTPAGVGALEPGHEVRAGIDGIAELWLRVCSRLDSESP